VATVKAVINSCEGLQKYTKNNNLNDLVKKLNLFENLNNKKKKVMVLEALKNIREFSIYSHLNKLNYFLK